MGWGGGAWDPQRAAVGCWTMLEIALAPLMTLWFGALVCIIREAILPPLSRRNDGHNLI
jgi:hypothetical protein